MLHGLMKYLSLLFGFTVLHGKQASCAADSVNLSGVSENLASVVSLMIFILVSSCVLQFITSKINEKLPISLILFIYGMIIYGILMSFDEQRLPFGILRWLAGVRRIDNSILYFIALPILLYEATQTINWYSFCNFFLAGTTLAVVGVIFQVAILGILFHYTLGIREKWSFSISFLLASILSSTDPVAVLSILGDANAPDKLITMFNGESLINDGTSVLLFQFFYLMTIGQSNSFWYYVVLFIKLLFLSPLLGVACGTFVVVWVSFIRKWHVVQSLISISMGYLLYFCAEYYLNVSGPLSIVCYGLFVKAYGVIVFDREALEKHNVLVEGLSYISNYVVFTISGILTIGMLKSQFLISDVGMKILKLFIVYLFLNLARAVMLLAFKPVLSYTGYRINAKELVLLLWGGLRGAMVLVLGLRLETDTKVEDLTSDLLSFYIAGSSMLILVLQGFTFDWLFRALNPYPMNPQRMEQLRKTLTAIDRMYRVEVDALKTHWLFKNSDVVDKANFLVPCLAELRWSKMGRLLATPPTVKMESLVVIEDNREVVKEDAEVEDEENIFLFNQEMLGSNKFPNRLLSKTQNPFQVDPNGSRISSRNSFNINTNLSFNVNSNFSFNAQSIISVPALEAELAAVEKLETEGQKQREDQIYVMIFNALAYIYREMYKKDFIDGKSLLTLQNTLNISRDFAIDRLNPRSISAWKSVLRRSNLDGGLFETLNDGNEIEKVEKMDGFEFEWFVLSSNLEEIMNRRLNFAKRSNVAFILDIILAYIEGHEKLLGKPANSLEIMLGEVLFKSYEKQINSAKKYVFTIKNKMNFKFYYCLMVKAASTMINLKKGVVDKHHASGALLAGERDQIVNLLDRELYRISNKTNYVKIVKTIIRKFYYVVTFNKKVHTSTNPV